MKKTVCIAASILLLSQSTFAGKYLDYFQDENGNQAVHFKKNGRSFEKGLSTLLQSASSHNVRQIYFHEDVTQPQREKVTSALCTMLKLQDLGGGLLEEKTTYDAIVSGINRQKKTGIVFQEMVSLDFRYTNTATVTKYLPFAHKFVEEMGKVSALFFTVSDMGEGIMDALQHGLSHNPKIKNVFFYGDAASPDVLANLISRLTSIPGQMAYYFSHKALSQLSRTNLDRVLAEYFIRVKTVQQMCAPKAVMPLVGEYMNYNDAAMIIYRDMCTSYSPLFKASFADYVNEREQRNLLVQLFKGEVALEKQSDMIQEILKKEQDGYKSLPIYVKDFNTIKTIIIRQLTERNLKVVNARSEIQKMMFIKRVLDRMWINQL